MPGVNGSGLATCRCLLRTDLRRGRRRADLEAGGVPELVAHHCAQQRALLYTRIDQRQDVKTWETATTVVERWREQRALLELRVVQAGIGGRRRAEGKGSGDPIRRVETATPREFGGVACRDAVAEPAPSPRRSIATPNPRRAAVRARAPRKSVLRADGRSRPRLDAILSCPVSADRDSRIGRARPPASVRLGPDRQYDRQYSHKPEGAKVADSLGKSGEPPGTRTPNPQIKSLRITSCMRIPAVAVGCP